MKCLASQTHESDTSCVYCARSVLRIGSSKRQRMMQTTPKAAIDSARVTTRPGRHQRTPPSAPSTKCIDMFGSPFDRRSHARRVYWKTTHHSSLLLRLYLLAFVFGCVFRYCCMLCRYCLRADSLVKWLKNWPPKSRAASVLFASSAIENTSRAALSFNPPTLRPLSRNSAAERSHPSVRAALRRNELNGFRT